MKKVFSMFLAVCIILALVSCTKDGTQPQPPTESSIPLQTQSMMATETVTEATKTTETTETPKPPFDGKIAIITNEGGNEYLRTAYPVVDKYGEDKIIHVTWPSNFLSESEKMINIVEELGNDPEIKAIVVNTASTGTAAAFERLRKTRKDVYVILYEPDLGVTADNYVKIADLIIMTDKLYMGPAMVQQSHKLGADTLVDLSIKWSTQDFFGERNELIKEECEKLGIEFVDKTYPIPASGISHTDVQKYIIEGVPKMVGEYGKDTAFFSTNCAMQSSLIRAVVETGAIYPQPCCPSPYHGFPYALGFDSINNYEDPFPDYEYCISEIRSALSEKNIHGRLSTWPVRDDYMDTYVGAEYAIKWINGEVPKEGVDVEVLKQLMEDYAGVEVYLTPYTDEYPYTDEGTGETYDNFLMMRMDYITFE